MKILKIENANGFFWAANSNEWLAIDQIDKDGLMNLLNIYLEQTVEIDNYDELLLTNKAQQIIYKGLFEKFESLSKNKAKFQDEADRTYLEAIQKYSQS